MNILTPIGYKDIDNCQIGDEVVYYDAFAGVKDINVIEGIERYDSTNYRLEVPVGNPYRDIERWETITDELGTREVPILSDEKYKFEPDPFEFYIINNTYKLFKNQLIWVNDCCVHVFDLKLSDVIYDDNNNDIVITSIEKVTDGVYYRVHISGDHSYIADGLTLHNASMYWNGTSVWATTASWWTDDTHTVQGAIPTSSDNAIFNASSTGTVTASTTMTCADYNANGFTGTTNIASGTMNCYGLFYLQAGGTFTAFVSAVNFLATSAKNITTSARQPNGVWIFNGPGGSWQLQDNLTFSTAKNLTLTQGTLDLNGKTLTNVSAFSLTGSTTRTITYGSGCSINCIALVATDITNLTVTDGTNGHCNISGGAAPFTTGNISYGNIVLTGASQTITGSFTCVSFTKTGTAAKTNVLTIAGDITCTAGSSAIKVYGNSVINRVLIATNLENVQRTITAASTDFQNVDFRGIIGAGAGNWDLSAITGGSGDALNNSGITFTTAANLKACGITSLTASTATHWTESYKYRVPTSDESNTGGFTTAPLWSKVDNYTIDDSAYIIAITNTGGNCTFGFTAFDVAAGQTITNLMIVFRAQDVTIGTNKMRGMVKVGATYYATADAEVEPGASFVTYKSNFATNPATGSAWTVAQINGTDGTNPLNAFGVTGSDFLPDINVSMCFAVVTYGAQRTPLPQDNVSLDSLAIKDASKSCTFDMPRIGKDVNLNNGVENTPTLSFSVNFTIYGNLTLPNVTLAVGNIITFAAASNVTFNTGGGAITNCGVTVNTYGGKLTMAGGGIVNTSAYPFQISYGGFDDGGFNYSTIYLLCNISTVKLYIAGYWTITNYTSSAIFLDFTKVDVNNYSFAGSTIKIPKTTGNTGFSYLYDFAGLTFNNIWFDCDITAGGDDITINNGFTCNVLTLKKMTQAGSYYKFQGGKTFTCNEIVITNASAGNLCGIMSTNTIKAIFVKVGAVVNIDFVDMSYITGSPENTWYVGANSTLNSCTNIYNTAPPSGNTQGLMMFFMGI